MRERSSIEGPWAIELLLAGCLVLHAEWASAASSPDQEAESAPEPTPFTLNQPAAEAHVAYGAYTGDGFANPYGFGLGLRAGVTLPQSIYLGGIFEYYFGGSDERSNGFFESIRSSANFVLLQAEPGYDFAFSEDLVLRPQLNLGFAYAQREDCIADVCDEQSDANLAMAPAGTLLFRQDSYVLYFGVRYSAVATASDRSSGGGFLLTAGVGTPLERLGVRFFKDQP
ncbi:MAG: hypothetical protein SFV15_04600 [Polyangiaceae bacterium]|nr:hypothetical protein [Polyangiaceae bacterium]